jgi:glycerol-3-phosphate responsive antiterminator
VASQQIILLLKRDILEQSNIHKSIKSQNAELKVALTTINQKNNNTESIDYILAENTNQNSCTEQI